MAKLNIICKCKNSVEANVGQNTQGGRLNWFLSYRCHVCGNAVEADGIDETPKEIRSAIISQEGECGLFVPEGTENIAVLFATLRKALNLNLKEVSSIKKLIPGRILKGTKAEMDRIQIQVKNAGIEVFVRKV